MKKIKEYKGIIIIVLILILGAFYWYEWRPNRAIKYCAKWARNSTSEIITGRKDNNKASLGEASIYKFYDFAYKSCLRKKGF